MGCATPEGATGSNIARQIALRAGLPGHDQRHDRQPLLLVRPADHRAWRRSASSPARATSSSPAASRAISCVQNEMPTSTCSPTPGCVEHKPEIYWNDAADRRAGRQALRHRARAHGRATAPRSQQKATAARDAGKFDDEIAPITTCIAGVADAVTGPAHEGSDGQRTTKASAPAPPTRASTDIKPAIARRRDLRRQRQPVLATAPAPCVVMNEKLRRAARPEAARPLPRLRGRRLRARRDGHRPGVRGAQAAQAPRPEGRRHRPVGAERGVRGAGALLRATRSASRRTGSTSTAARSRSAIPTACQRRSA